jgi:hypothetical protein
MKKFFPLSMVAVLAVISFTSCQKNVNGGNGNGSYYCRCGYKSALTGEDSVVAGTTYGAIYSQSGAQTQCTKYQSTIQHQYPNAVCTIE